MMMIIITIYVRHDNLHNISTGLPASKLIFTCLHIIILTTYIPYKNARLFVFVSRECMFVCVSVCRVCVFKTFKSARLLSRARITTVFKRRHYIGTHGKRVYTGRL